MLRKRRLLSIAHSYVVTVNRRLVNEMARLGGDSWEVTAVAPSFFAAGNDLRSTHFKALPGEASTVAPVDAYLTSKIHFFVYHPELRSILNRGWDVVHCWEEPYILAGGQVALWTKRGTPLVYRSAQSLDKRYPPPFNLIERYAMGKAAGWICSGETVEANLKQRAGYANLPMRRIPLGVDLANFHPDRAAGYATRRRLGWEEAGPPVVGYLGRFSQEKGLTLLMNALDGVATPWRALFVGAGVLEPVLREWAKRHGDRVRICADVTHDDVPPYVNAMDMLCAPSQTMPNWREQFGRMLVEAFAAGVPVIGSDSGEIPLVVGGVGVVVGEKDTAGWQRAIQDLLESPKKRAELSAKGIAAANEKYAWPVVAGSYLEFFDSLADL